jgi:hypothetical protein
MGNDNIISYQSARDKRTLVGAYYVRKDSLNLVSNGLSDDFERNIAKRDRSEVTRLSEVIDLRNEAYVGGIKGGRVAIVVENIKSRINDIFSNNIPISVTAFCWETIWARGSQTLHVLYSINNFQLSVGRGQEVVLVNV